MNIESLRKSFEKVHPHPLSNTWNIYVRFIDGKYVYVANEDTFWEDDKNLVDDYQNKWEGYQSCAEGLEDAVKYCELIDATPENQHETMLYDTLVERDQLRAALKKYGKHADRCDSRPRHAHDQRYFSEMICDCGLAEVLREPHK